MPGDHEQRPGWTGGTLADDDAEPSGKRLRAKVRRNGIKEIIYEGGVGIREVDLHGTGT